MHYSDYYWKQGKPYGRQKIAPESVLSYKIIADPYFKRISVEKYQCGQLEKVIYDSILLDFRHLKSATHQSWQRITLKESDQQKICLLRDQDDRTVLIETLDFDADFCRSCTIASVHGFRISTHKMHYQALNDLFDGVILFDNEGKPVMQKKYLIDALTGEFGELVEENWSLSY